MSRRTRLHDHGLSVVLPGGWDGEVYLRDLDDNPHDAVASFKPVLHTANFPLPPGRGDFGSVAVESMGSGAIFLAVLEYEDASVGTTLFDNRMPTQLWPREFGPNNLQRPLPNQAGAQRFATVHERAFCVYAVLGSYARRRVLLPELNRVLETIEIEPR